MVINDQKKSNQKLDLILDEIKSIKKFYGVVDQEFLNVNIFVYFFWFVMYLFILFISLECNERGCKDGLWYKDLRR